MALMDDELPPAGEGNGGRACLSCSCVLIMMTIILTGAMFIPPYFIENLGFADTMALPEDYEWTTPTCLSMCCCLGVGMFFLSIWLILIDDPSKAKSK